MSCKSATNGKWLRRRFLRNTRGSSTIQQAIMIALIVGAAFLALDGLGFVANQTFTTASTQLAGDASVLSSDTADAAEMRANSDSDVALSARPATMGSFVLRLIVMLVACPLGAWCWYRLNRKEQKCKADEELPAVTPQTDSQIERDLVFDKRHNLLRLFNADIGMLMTSRIMVRHVMSEKVHSVQANTPVDQVREIMQEKKIRNVLVCDKQGRLIGLITASGMENQPGATAAEVMKGDPATVAPNSLLNPAITQLIKQRLYCLPVVDEGILVGVVTTTDVMMALQCTLHALQKTANEVVADLPPGTVPGFMLALHAGEEHTAAELETAGTGV